jgi:hypothetical protein
VDVLYHRHCQLLLFDLPLGILSGLKGVLSLFP